VLHAGVGPITASQRLTLLGVPALRPPVFLRPLAKDVLLIPIPLFPLLVLYLQTSTRRSSRYHPAVTLLADRLTPAHLLARPAWR